MSQSLITEGMLSEAASAIRSHRVRRGKCSCGAVTPATTDGTARHHVDVMAEVIAPALVAEMMSLLAQVAAAGVEEKVAS